jgi:hypothetical protein
MNYGYGYEEPKKTCCQTCLTEFNPLNRFMFVLCPSYEVDNGWGWGCCGCRAFSFTCGVIVFSLIIVINSIKDINEIIASDYLSRKTETSDIDKVLSYLKGLVFDEKDETFIRFFYVKIVADSVAITASVIGFLSIPNKSFCIATIAYYVGFISFLINSSFIIFVCTRICRASFWAQIGFTNIGNIFLWFIFEYVWLLFTWMLFCNMVDIGRKNQKAKEQQQASINDLWSR